LGRDKAAAHAQTVWESQGRGCEEGLETGAGAVDQRRDTVIGDFVIVFFLFFLVISLTRIRVTFWKRNVVCISYSPFVGFCVNSEQKIINTICEIKSGAGAP